MRAGTFFRFATAATALALAGCDGGGGGGDIKVDSLEPNQGPLGGGQTVIIEGSGFLAGGSAPDLALFGSVLTTEVSALSDGQLQVVTPHGFEPGEVDVLVFNTNGYTLADGAYTYADPPTITEVDADSGHYSGGDEVTVIGTGFQEFEAGQPTLTFDGVPATNVRVQSDTEILAIVPPGTPLHLATAELHNNRGDAAKVEAYLYTAAGLLAITGRGNDAGSGQGAIYFVDGDTGATSFVHQIDQSAAQIQGMVLGEDDIVYGTATHLNGSGGTTDRSLYKIHLQYGELESVGPMAVADGEIPAISMQVPEIEFHDGTLYGFNRFEQSFGSISTSTGLFTRIGDQGLGYAGRGSGLASDGDTLYYIQFGNLYTVDTESGQHSIDAQPISGIPGGGLTGWTYLDGSLYGVERGFGGGPGLRHGNGGGGGGGVALSRIYRVDLDDESLQATQFATVPGTIHGLSVAPATPTGGDQ